MLKVQRFFERGESGLGVTPKTPPRQGRVHATPSPPDQQETTPPRTQENTMFIKAATAITLAMSTSALFAGTCQSSTQASGCGAAEQQAAAWTHAGDHSNTTADIVDTAVNAGSFNTLAAALQAADFVGALKGDGPFTVFAPTDAAFAKLPKGTVESLLKPENRDTLVSILTYHVVPGDVRAKNVVKLSGAETLNGQRVNINAGGKVTVDGATVTATDIACSNGVIHVIDTVIMPTSENIVEVAYEAGSFNTLIAAAKAAGLAGTLSGGGPFTVFAPTDAAFAKLPAGTVESLLKPENKSKLQAILKLHVVEGRVYAERALEVRNAESLQGGMLDIRVQRGAPMVNNAKIVNTDIDASNGVIHVIDTVLLPE